MQNSEVSLKLLKQRKSCRSYTGEQITENELSALLQAGNAAPVAMNRINDLKICVIQTKEILQQLEEVTQKIYSTMGIKLKAIYNAPTLILVAVKKQEGPYQKALYCTAACILENMIFTATELELGNVFLTGITTAVNQSPDLLQLIGIPKEFEAAAALAVGKTNQTLSSRNLENLKFPMERI